MLAMQLDIRDRLPAPRWSEVLGLLEKALAHDLTAMTQSHLRALDAARPNTLGGKRSHYYGQAARNTRGDSSPGRITISIQQIGMNLHYNGGTVTPKVAKWLTIPAAPEAYGHRAREFDDLYFVLTKRRDLALLKRGSKVMYWLKKETTHQPDHTVIPDERAYYAQASVTVNRVCEALRSGRRTVGGAIIPGGTP